MPVSCCFAYCETAAVCCHLKMGGHCDMTDWSSLTTCWYHVRVVLQTKLTPLPCHPPPPPNVNAWKTVMRPGQMVGVELSKFGLRSGSCSSLQNVASWPLSEKEESSPPARPGPMNTDTGGHRQCHCPAARFGQLPGVSWGRVFVIVIRLFFFGGGAILLPPPPPFGAAVDEGRCRGLCR